MTFSKLLTQSLIWRGFYFITLFAVNVVLSRYLGASASGAVFYISNTFVFIQLIAGLCLENGITFFASGRRISSNRLLWLCLLWIVMIVCIQIIIYTSFSLHSDVNIKHVQLYAFCFITGLLLTTYSSNLFYANGNFYLPNFILAVGNLFFIAFVLMNYSRHDADNETIITLYFFILLVQGIAITLTYIIQNKSWRELAFPPVSDIKKFTRYSLSVLLFNVLLFFVYRIDYYFVRYSPVCNAADLGNYIQASKLGQMLLVIPQIVGSAVYPQVSSGNDVQAVSRAIVVLAKSFAILFIVIFFTVLAIGKWLFPFLFGVTFHHVQIPLLFLLPGIYGLSVISFLSNFFSGKGNVFISVMAAAMALLIVVAGDFIFVFRYGIEAAAMVSSVGYLAMSVFYVRLFIKEAGISVTGFFVLNKDDIKVIKNVIRKNS